jgi:hypothetical protein
MSGKFPIPNRWWAILTLVCLTVQNLHLRKVETGPLKDSGG